jgi:hypothetical protein
MAYFKLNETVTYSLANVLTFRVTNSNEFFFFFFFFFFFLGITARGGLYPPSQYAPITEAHLKVS